MKSAVQAPQPAKSQSARVLTKAAWRAAMILGLSQQELAATLGLSPSSVSRIKGSSFLLDPSRKEWELALLWVRVFRSLDSITGSQDESSRTWLHSHNNDLAGRPVDLIQSVPGLVHVVEYLDAHRARL